MTTAVGKGKKIGTRWRKSRELIRKIKIEEFTSAASIMSSSDSSWSTLSPSCNSMSNIPAIITIFYSGQSHLTVEKRVMRKNKTTTKKTMRRDTRLRDFTTLPAISSMTNLLIFHNNEKKNRVRLIVPLRCRCFVFFSFLYVFFLFLFFSL